MSFHRNTRHSPEGPRHLSNDNVRRILSICDGDSSKQNLGDIVRIIATTGIRVSELKNLCWACVDFPNSRLVVDDRKAWRMRRIRIGAETCEILQARHDREPVSDFVFGGAREKLFNRASRQLRVAGVRSSFGPLSFNVVRNTFFERLMLSGTPIETVISIAGSRPFSSTKLFRVSLLTTAQAYERAMRDFARLPQC